MQHDNATSHFAADWPPFVAAATADDWHIQLTEQPPNSPDTNVNDLGFFRALQSAQWDTIENARSNKDNLIAAVLGAFAAYEPMKLNFAFLTLQSCIAEIIKCHGDNIYKVPHMGKERLARLGQLPYRVAVDEQCLDTAVEFLDDNASYVAVDNAVDGGNDAMEEDAND
jgi:hypothetical protein